MKQSTIHLNLPFFFIEILSSQSSRSFTPPSSTQTAPPPLASHDESAFSTIIAQHTRLLDEDNEDNEPVIVSEDWTKISITQLFNFTSNSWSSRYARFAALTFEEELELYDLLEMDGEGDEDPDAGFDDTTQDILLS